MSSVIVQFDPYARTGNRLCQFAFGLILAKEKNVPFYCQPIPGFLGTYGYSDTSQSTPEQIKTIQFGTHNTDYSLLIDTNNTIVINSYLQKYQYFINSISFLQQLFAVDNNITVDKDELVIHIRGTDYRGGNVHIKDHIYLDILDKLSPAKASLVTDDINTDIVRQLCSRGVKLVTQSNETNRGDGLNSHEMFDYLYMLNSNMLFISQSTFSWWAGFLGNQEKVIVPYDKCNNGMWKIVPAVDDIDLVPENNKFQKIIYETN